ncbi:hypothetical protein ACWF95_41255 [Streptomyces vinaceus]
MDFLTCVGRAAVAGSLSAAAFVFPQSSSAAPGDLTCLGGTSEITFSPGLTNTPQMVTINSVNKFPHCSSSDPSITSAEIPASERTVLRSCTDLLNSGTGDLSLAYNTGETTTYSSTFSSNYLLGTLTVLDSGPVTAGKFSGGNAVGAAEYLHVNLLQCGTAQGITKLTGTYTVLIT